MLYTAPSRQRSGLYSITGIAPHCAAHRPPPELHKEAGDENRLAFAKGNHVASLRTYHVIPFKVGRYLFKVGSERLASSIPGDRIFLGDSLHPLDTISPSRPVTVRVEQHWIRQQAELKLHKKRGRPAQGGAENVEISALIVTGGLAW